MCFAVRGLANQRLLYTRLTALLIARNVTIILLNSYRKWMLGKQREVNRLDGFAVNGNNEMDRVDFLQNPLLLRDVLKLKREWQQHAD